MEWQGIVNDAVTEKEDVKHKKLREFKDKYTPNKKKTPNLSI